MFRERRGNKINILYLLEKDQYITKMSRVRFHGMRELGKLVNVIYWGIGWNNYDNNITVDENIKNMGIKIDYIICYKPLILNNFSSCKIAKCITYNEMWDEKTTLDEINKAKPDLIICHHENDMTKYQTVFSKRIHHYTKLYHNPHCAEKTIFYDQKSNKDIDILLCGSVGRHYPLRRRLRDIVKIMSTKYNCLEYTHPGYIIGDAFTDIYLKDFAKIINKAKICITCTSKYKYRLGKMVEIPMCNSVLCCDLPDQNQDEFSKMMIVIDESMSDDEITDKLIYYLENSGELERIRELGYKWSQKYIQSHYATNFLCCLEGINKNNIKIFILADELKNMKNKWICDLLKEEFIQYSKVNIVSDPKDADIIWLLAPWSTRKINKKYLEEKFVVSTIHHVDTDKYDEFREYYNYIDSITNRYHTICKKSYENLKILTHKEIIIANFWINENNYFKIYDKNNLRKKYNIPENMFVVGSFQKDTEGKDDMTPKLSKGPDIFIKIVEDMKKDGKDVFVILTGWRRNYIMTGLDKLGIKYIYCELIDLEGINELYNCLDLYIVSSRVEGGPRSIMECGLAKVPIISTDVGIVRSILHSDSIFDMDNFISYKKAKPNITFGHQKTSEYTVENYIKKFVNDVFYEIGGI